MNKSITPKNEYFINKYGLSKIVGRGQLPGDEVAISRVVAAFKAASKNITKKN